MAMRILVMAKVIMMMNTWLIMREINCGVLESEARR